MNRCRGRVRALAAWVMDCVPTEYPAWSYFVLAAAILVAGQVSAHLERKASEPPVPDSLQAGCAPDGSGRRRAPGGVPPGRAAPEPRRRLAFELSHVSAMDGGAAAVDPDRARLVLTFGTPVPALPVGGVVLLAAALVAASRRAGTAGRGRSPRRAPPWPRGLPGGNASGS